MSLPYKYEQLQIRLWAALDNKDSKYIKDFAQELFDLLIKEEYSLKKQYDDIYWDLDDANCKISSLEDDIANAEDRYDRLARENSSLNDYYWLLQKENKTLLAELKFVKGMDNVYYT